MEHHHASGKLENSRYSTQLIVTVRQTHEPQCNFFQANFARKMTMLLLVMDLKRENLSQASIHFFFSFILYVKPITFFLAL